MTNSNSNSNSLLNIVHNCMHKFDALSADVNAKNTDVLAARDTLEQAVNAYNQQTLEAAYADFDKADAPLQALAIRATWDKMTTRRKESTTSIVFRSTRFDVLSYLQHVVDTRKNGKTVNLPASIDTIKDALKKASEALSAFLIASVNQDTEPVSIKNTAAAVYNYARLYTIDGLKVRPADVRYLCAVVCKAGELGEIRAIKPETVARYLLDVVHVQTKNGGKYALEAAKKAAKKEEEKKAENK